MLLETYPGSLRVRYPRLSLTGYRELAAHVAQVPGVTARLLEPNSPTFDYTASQVGALEITVTTPHGSDRLAQILAYYGPWEPIHNRRQAD
ncbi:MAG: hypothetical protein ACUVSQ_11540 [Pseudanabaenaceae cyanobacterium]